MWINKASCCAVEKRGHGRRSRWEEGVGVLLHELQQPDQEPSSGRFFLRKRKETSGNDTGYTQKHEPDASE